MPPVKTIVTDYVLMPVLVIAAGLGALALIAAGLVFDAAAFVAGAAVAILAKHGGTIALAAAIAFAAWTVAPLLAVG